jgi:hypothetical protein
MALSNYMIPKPINAEAEGVPNPWTAASGKATWLELAAGRNGGVNGDYDFALGVALFEVTEGFGCGA